MGRGRRKVTEKIPVEKIIELYKKEMNAKKVAEVFKISYRTVRRYLKKEGISIRRGSPPDEKHTKYAQLVKWVKDHPKVKLPRSPAGISRITGLSIGAVTNYLYRRKQELSLFLKSIPDLKKSTLKLRDENGMIIPLTHLKTYEFMFDPWNFEIRLVCILKNNTKFVFKFTLDELKKLINHQGPSEPK